MRIGIAGDWHVDIKWAMTALETYRAAGITEILHVGDFSLDNTAPGLQFLDTIEAFLSENSMVIAITMGNHDNYSYMRSDWDETNEEGFLVNQEYPHVLISPRTHRFVRAGRSFLSSGGANSINRSSLTPNVDWWEEEQISLGDVYRSVEDGRADIMITHEAPEGVTLFSDAVHSWSAEQLAYASKSRASMRQIVDHVKPEILFHGHYHNYMDTVSRMHDGESFYEQRVIGLDMNGKLNNMAILDLSDLTVTML